MNEPLRGCPTCGTEVSEADLGLRDYRWVADALPGRVAPMDLDAVLEHRGKVLIQEFKPLGVPVPLGQRITLTTFVKMGADVWIVWEDKDRKHAEVGSLNRFGEVDFVERMTITRLRARVSAWYKRTTEES